jgi:hypothetical protein
MAPQGRAEQRRCGEEWFEAEGPDRDWQAWHGVARIGPERHGNAGKAWGGVAWPGGERQDQESQRRRDEARRGQERQGEATQVALGWRGSNGWSKQGWVRHRRYGRVRRSEVRIGGFR